MELEARVTCRRQIITTRTRHGNQLKQTRRGGCKAAAKALQRVIDVLNGQIDSLDGQIRKLIESDGRF